jgi:hypothetical protein
MGYRRPPRIEPVHCDCEGGGDRAKEHAKPGAKAPIHLGNCPHSELRHTTRARPKPRTVPRIRLI